MGINPFTAHRHIFFMASHGDWAIFYLRLQPVLYLAWRFVLFWNYRTIKDWQARHGYNANAPQI